MRGILIVAGLVTLAAVAVVGQPPATPKPEEQPGGHLVSPEDHLAEDAGVHDDTHPDHVDGDEHTDQVEDEENVFASVELAATNADLAIKLMKRALSVLLESSASAMEHTEALLKSGVVSVSSVTQGAATAAKQLAVAPEPVDLKPKIPEHKPPPPPQTKTRSGWWW
ncbi:unnamed protein product [Bemisia tabaci]|uniref:Uncharacterized protein n=1 Tax=Bemisia tabaci TaxID=7038 RepID=A0A9P0F2Y1_BEMTA|nr:unnamed protein product [Bemisia tabaci]